MFCQLVNLYLFFGVVLLKFEINPWNFISKIIKPKQFAQIKV